MKAQNVAMAGFLKEDNVNFIVPVYQRNYEWSRSHCQQLWNDIVQVAKTKESHFFGTICYKEEMADCKQYFIVDGQQRITSVMLLIKAMLDVSQDLSISQYLQACLFNLLPGLTSKDDSYIRLHLNPFDNEIYRILLTVPVTEYERLLTPKQKRGYVYQNYLFFQDLLQQYLDESGSLLDLVNSLQSLLVVGLAIEKENPQDIFSSLNSTGLELSQIDLLRNYLFMQFSYAEQQQLYDVWREIELNVPYNMERFFVDYLICTTGSTKINGNLGIISIEQNKLFDVFRNYYVTQGYQKHFDETFDFLLDISHKSNLYRDFCFSEDDELEDIKQNLLRTQYYELQVMCNFYSCGSVLLFLASVYDNGDMSKQELLDCLDALIMYTVRMKIVGRTVDNVTFSISLLRKLLNWHEYGSMCDTLWYALQTCSSAIPEDKIFKQALETSVFLRQKKDLLKYLWVRDINEKTGQHILDLWEKTDLEYVLPSKKTIVWDSDLSAKDKKYYRQYCYALGNIVLLEQYLDTEKLSFAEKKQVYSRSDFEQTRLLSQYTEWHIDDVDKRNVDVANELLQICQYPKLYQTVGVSSSEVYLLDDSFERFTSRKPGEIIIRNEKISVSAWTQFFETVCQRVYEADPLSFTKVAQSFSGFYLEDDTEYQNDKRYRYVCGNIYVRTTMTTKRTLERLSKFLEIYDSVCRTDWKNNILFSVR